MQQEVKTKEKTKVKIQVKQYSIKGGKRPPFRAIERFIDALETNHSIRARVLLDCFPELATLKGNFFALPLVIAGKHGNIDLMNDLLEKGACPHLASTQCKNTDMPSISRKFLSKTCVFRRELLEKMHVLH